MAKGRPANGWQRVALCILWSLRPALGARRGTKLRRALWPCHLAVIGGGLIGFGLGFGIGFGLGHEKNCVR